MVFSSLEQTGRCHLKMYFNRSYKGSQGRKMSKSLGNGIDPYVIDEYGADTLRFTLVTETLRK